MKKLNKFLILLGIIPAILMLFGIAAFAAEPEDEEPTTVTLDDVEFAFEYTSDSATTEGFTVRTYYDPISGSSGLELVPNFGIGYAIYDDPETKTIDGIRINGAEVTSLRIPITSETKVLKYTVAVRTVYVEGASGDLARILDGTYNYMNLLTNPIIIIQAVYWSFMVISGVAGFIVTIRTKRKKVKTLDEIADKVTEKREELEQSIINTVTDTVKAEVLPLAQASVKSGKEAVKAILLSTSKSKDAPAALLDVFKESADIDISNIVDEVYAALNKSIAEHNANHDATVKTLHNIANHVIQEDVSNATDSKQSTTSKAGKSVF